VRSIPILPVRMAALLRTWRLLAYCCCSKDFWRKQPCVDPMHGPSGCPWCPKHQAATCDAPMEVNILRAPSVAVRGTGTRHPLDLVHLVVRPEHAVPSTQAAVTFDDLCRWADQCEFDATAVATGTHRCCLRAHVDLHRPTFGTRLSQMSRWPAPSIRAVPPRASVLSPQ